MRVKQYTARGYDARAHVTIPETDPRPVVVARFGWLSRASAERVNLVRTTSARG